MTQESAKGQAIKGRDVAIQREELVQALAKIMADTAEYEFVNGTHVFKWEPIYNYSPFELEWGAFYTPVIST